MAASVTTKTVTFRSDDGVENFKIVLNVKVDKGKVLSVKEGSEELFEYLKHLNLVRTDMDFLDWLDSFENLTLFYSGYKESFKLRKKASMLGLVVVPGECFEKRKLESLKNIKQVVC